MKAIISITTEFAMTVYDDETPERRAQRACTLVRENLQPKDVYLDIVEERTNEPQTP